MPTITFSEQPLNTVNPTYFFAADNFVALEGEIVNDGSQPTSPIIAANTRYSGPVNFDFQVAVSTVSFEAGYFNSIGSTTANFYNSSGTLLFSKTNSIIGLQQFSYTNNAGIARVEVVQVGADAAGFGVDTLSFTTLGAVAVATPADADTKGLLWGSKWGYTDLSWSAPTAASAYTDNGYEAVNGFQTMNAAQLTAIRQILSNYQSVSGLNFTETNNGDYADLRFAEATSVNDGDGLDALATAQGGPPDPGRTPVSWGDNWFNSTNYNSPSVGSFANAAGFMHEIGHSLGLKHGHQAPKVSADHNSYEYTVMTYSQYVGDTTAGDSAPNHPTTLMMLDIQAIQYMYGANYGTNSGSNTYTWSPTTGEMFIDGVGQGAPGSNYILMTIWDGGGVSDTYNFSNYAGGVSADLRPGQWSTTTAGQLADLGDGNNARWNIANALLYGGSILSLIENAIGGSGNDTLRGNEAENTLTGNAGNDTIYGEDSTDSIYGNQGADTLWGGLGNDWIHGGQNNDRIYGNQGLDDLYGGLGADWVHGGQGNDIIYGNQGADTLFGGLGLDTIFGNEGADDLSGGLGDDWLHGGQDNDWLYGNEGVDELWGGLGDDWVHGGQGNDRIYGNLGVDNLSGGLGDDWLHGGQDNDTLYGNLGLDELWGGLGDDWLHGGQGNDTIYGNLGVDELWGGLGNDWLHGGQDNDIIYGNQGTDELWGGLGNDWLHGGQDNDTLYGNLGLDELWGGTGNDWIHGGQGNDSIFGNQGNDELFGGLGDDWVHGGQNDDTIWGGLGSDTINGGFGFDIARFAGSLAEYDSLNYGGGSWRITNIATGDIDTLSSIERLQYDDGFLLV